MRAIFSVVSLLVVLALVGVLAVRQLRATGQGAVVSPAAVPTEPAQRLPQRVQSDVTKALEQGAAARKEAADQ